MNGKQLRALFLQFNDRYWGGRLPAYKIHVVPSMTSVGESGRWKKRRRLIEIQRGLSDEEVISTLLHEMAHAATNGHHGMPWKKEMIRLRKAGAPLAHADLNISIADWDGTRVGRNRFRGTIQDALMDGADFTLSDAIRWFVRSVGRPTSITEFRRKYPWAGDVFNDAKRKYAEEQTRDAALRAMLKQKQA